MRVPLSKMLFLIPAATFVALVGCGAPTANTNLTAVNTNSGVANSISNSNLNAVSTTASSSAVDAREPEQYQANIKLSLQTSGANQTASVPTIGAVVARSGADRVMEFNLPKNEKVIYLDKGGMNYLILPNRRQYAELTKEAIGFEIRRLLLPEHLVNQAKSIPGVTRAGEETLNGRQVVKYTYQSATNTGTQAGTVATESYMLIDKETGLPLRTETVSQSQSGANVQGVSGVRVVTEMTDIKTTPDPKIFTLPADFQRIEPEAVKAQVNAIFSVVGSLVGQMMNQAAQPAGNTAASPASSPMR
ncbi:MAG: hypothetical protein ABR535_00675 [Pyrinomonadaceae bacterium]